MTDEERLREIQSTLSDINKNLEKIAVCLARNNPPIQAQVNKKASGAFDLRKLKPRIRQESPNAAPSQPQKSGGIFRKETNANGIFRV